MQLQSNYKYGHAKFNNYESVVPPEDFVFYVSEEDEREILDMFKESTKDTYDPLGYW